MNPFEKLEELVREFTEKRESYNIEDLQRLREDLSINFFLLADSIGSAISFYEKYEHDRKIMMAKYFEDYRSEGFTISESENKARISAEPEAKLASEALRKKEKAKIISAAIPQILNSIASRINHID